MARRQQRLDATVEGTMSLGNLNTDKPHTEIGIRFEDSSGNPVTPGAGTFTVKIQSFGGGDFELVEAGEDVDATASIKSLTYTSFGEQLQYTPTGVTVAATVRITLSSSRA